MSEPRLDERLAECKELAPNRVVFRKYISIFRLVFYTLMVVILVIRHKINSQRLAVANTALLLAWFVCDVMYICFLFTQN